MNAALIRNRYLHNELENIWTLNMWFYINNKCNVMNSNRNKIRMLIFLFDDNKDSTKITIYIG